MKNNFFKFGAALTAALMVFSALSAVAFADEADVVEEAPAVVETVDTEAPAEDVETPAEDVEAPAEDVEAPAEDVEAPAEDVEAPAEDAEAPAEDVEAPAEDAEIPAEDVEAPAEEVVIPMEVTEGVTEEEVQLATDDPTRSVISIGDITAVDNTDYYTVTVPFSVAEEPEQMTFFVYDITSITGGNNNTPFAATTPAGYIDQKAGEVSGTLVFNLPKGDNRTDETATNEYNDESIIVVKVGGTGVTTPDAKSFALADAGQGGEGVTYGDINGDGSYNAADVLMVLQYGANNITLEPDQITAADVNGDGSYNASDALLILQRGANKIESFPVEE